jgi:hypothetical protein
MTLKTKIVLEQSSIKTYVVLTNLSYSDSNKVAAPLERSMLTTNTWNMNLNNTNVKTIADWTF